MNLTGNSIYRPQERGGVGVSIAGMKPEVRPQWPKMAYGCFASATGGCWYKPLLAAWDKLDETAPETPRA